MGLDMYLSKCPKVNKIEDLKTIQEFLNSTPNKLEAVETTIKDQGLWGITLNYNSHFISMLIEVGYWRKFNALHNWFVQNIQSGEDDCDYYLLSEDNFYKLKELINYISPENCHELLPTSDGFFFGSTDYDEYYWEKVENTKTIINYLDIVINFDRESLVYCSSW